MMKHATRSSRRNGSVTNVFWIFNPSTDISYHSTLPPVCVSGPPVHPDRSVGAMRGSTYIKENPFGFLEPIHQHILHNATPLTMTNWPMLFIVPLIPLSLVCYLVQIEGTRRYRLPIGILGCAMIVRAAMSYRFDGTCLVLVLSVNLHSLIFGPGGLRVTQRKDKRR